MNTEQSSNPDQFSSQSCNRVERMRSCRMLLCSNKTRPSVRGLLDLTMRQSGKDLTEVSKLKNATEKANTVMQGLKSENEIN